MSSHCFCTYVHFVRVCVTRGKAATAVFNSDQATKATAGLKPQIENTAVGESEGDLVWPG